jgi:hypothetical protein
MKINRKVALGVVITDESYLNINENKLKKFEHFLEKYKIKFFN